MKNIVSLKTISLIVIALSLIFSDTVFGDSDDDDREGLDPDAKQELINAGVAKYRGLFSPAVSTDVGQGWIKHTFDPGADEGPICITGSPYSVFTKAQDPDKLLIMLQGGGACWQDFYNCNLLSEAQEPPPPPVGIWGQSFDTGAGSIPNPIGDWSVVYMPYCDGSVFSGDNALVDTAFQAFVEGAFGLPPGAGPQIRFHRGLRNVTAGVDLAGSMFGDAEKIMVAGSSAGGVGAAGFTPFLVRMAFGNEQELMVFNDAGPNAVNLLDVPALLARAADWRFGQFYPVSCTECDAVSEQGTAVVKWRLDNDRSIRESFYSTDADTTNRFFLKVPTQQLYRNLVVSEHGKLNATHPDRYKRFIRSGDSSHTALQTPLLYVGTANGVPLHRWIDSFVNLDDDEWDDNDDDDDEDDDDENAWVDIVEDLVLVP